jgi:hypothetical protein
MYKIESKMAFINLSVPVSNMNIKCEVHYHICVYKGEDSQPNLCYDLDFIDLEDIMIDGLEVKDKKALFSFYKESLGIDLINEFEKKALQVLTDEELQKIANKMTWIFKN